MDLNLKNNLVAGPRPINIPDELWEDIKDMPGVELYEEEPTPKPAKVKKVPKPEAE